MKFDLVFNIFDIRSGNNETFLSLIIASHSRRGALSGTLLVTFLLHLVFYLLANYME
jgi:hypothetical protein